MLEYNRGTELYIHIKKKQWVRKKEYLMLAHRYDMIFTLGNMLSRGHL